MNNLDLNSQNVENNILPGREKTLYLYPIKRMFSDSFDKEQLLTYSPNVVNVRIIDIDDYQVFKGEIEEVTNYKYGVKSSTSGIDNEIDLVQSVSNTYITRQRVEYDERKLYLLSEYEIKNDIDIKIHGQIVQECIKENAITDDLSDHPFLADMYEQDELASNLLTTIKFNTVDVKTWTPKGSNDLVLIVGKQQIDFELKELQIETPKSFLLEGVKVLASDDNGVGYSNVISKDKLYPIWLNPIEVNYSGKMRMLNYWFSERILSFDIAKKFIDETVSSSLINELLFFSNDDVSHELAPYEIEKVKKVSIFLKGLKYKENIHKGASAWQWVDREYNQDFILEYDGTGKEKITILGRDGDDHPKNSNFVISKDASIDIPDYPNNTKDNYRTAKDFFLNSDGIGKILVTPDNAIEKGSLYDLLLEELSAVYNYQYNFKGAGYKDKQTGELNEMALYKQQFEGKTISEYIDGLEKTWEQKYPEYLSSNAYKNFKKIRTMLSPYLFGTSSIGGNALEDSKFILPYYFKLLSKPTFKDKNNNTVSDVKGGNGTWKYESLTLKIDSLYFDMKTESPLYKNVSFKSFLKGDNDIFNWQSISEIIDESKLPGLKNSDFKTSDVNVTKYLLYTNENITTKYGKDDNLFIINKSDVIKNINFKKLSLDIKDFNFNPEIIELTAIYSHGFYNFNLISTSNQISLKNIELFKKDKEQLPLVKISL